MDTKHLRDVASELVILQSHMVQACAVLQARREGAAEVVVVCREVLQGEAVAQPLWQLTVEAVVPEGDIG